MDYYCFASVARVYLWRFFIVAFNYVTRLIPTLLMSTGHLVFFAFIGISSIIGALISNDLFALHVVISVPFLIGLAKCSMIH